MSDPTDSFWAALPLGNGVEVLARDGNGLAALSKPFGVLSHPNEAGDQRRSLLTAGYDFDEEAYSWEGGRLWLLNRLDSVTSGVILVAADRVLAAAIRAQFKKREVRKAYRALVFGVPTAPRATWKDLVAVDRSRGRVRSSAGAGLPAHTEMTLVRAGGGDPRISLLALEPKTGRSHQLRVQCSRRGLPIIGDQTYGDFARNRQFAKRAGTKRMFLHSLSTAFSYEIGGRRFSFAAEAPLPEEFGAFL